MIEQHSIHLSLLGEGIFIGKDIWRVEGEILLGFGVKNWWSNPEK